MKTAKHSSHPILSQTQNNTTLWIGHLKTDNTDHFGGQTFTCPSEGLLNNIQVYSSAVTQPGEVILTLHPFDAATKTWGPAICNSKLNLERGDDARWIRFELDPVALQKGATYAFRLQATNALIGLGEAVSNAKKPFLFGLAWNGDTNNKLGRFFNYFSLAFKVELSA